MIPVTQSMLEHERTKPSKYQVPKWVGFCQAMLDLGFVVTLYRARTTCSKYVHVSNGSKGAKVRFGNHMPSKTKQLNKDSDFYVGVSHFGVCTTEVVIEQVKEYLNG